MMADAALPTDNQEIPDKLYFRIGEVSRLAGVKPFVLRFWETEFPQLAPKKSGTGHRLFRRKDVETILEIKRLLYQERFTIEGARNHLQTRSPITPAPKAKGKRQKPVPPPPATLDAGQGDLFGTGIPRAAWDTVRGELKAILDLLS